MEETDIRNSSNNPLTRSPPEGHFLQTPCAVQSTQSSFSVPCSFCFLSGFESQHYFEMTSSLQKSWYKSPNTSHVPCICTAGHLLSSPCLLYHCLPPPSSPVSLPGWPWCLLLCLFYPYCFLSYFGATTHVPLHAWVHFLKAKASITTIWGPRPEQYYWKTASQLQHFFKFYQFPQNCPSNKFVFFLSQDPTLDHPLHTAVIWLWSPLTWNDCSTYVCVSSLWCL